MRDALVVLFIFAALLVALRYPFVGVLTWAWFTLMTPHQLAYGTFGIPLNLVIAAVTIGSLVIHGQFKRGGFDAITIFLFVFSGWLFVSQTFSLDAENSAEYFDRFIKTILFVIVCAQVATDKLRLHALLWIVVLSLGYFGAKGALFTLATLGEYRVQGIPNTVLEDNNHMGIALATLLPLILYLRGEVTKPWIRHGLIALFVMTIVSIIGTHSRGAFISLIMFGGYFWLKSSHKFSILAALMLVTLPAIAFMPAKWTERMATIGEATQDASFMGRIDAWVINYKLAEENPITGGGLRNSYEKEIAQQVAPLRAESAKAAHSIYFEILGGTGFVGLALYLGILGSAFLSARMIYLRRKKAGADDWILRFGYFSQISLAVFCVGGASVSLEMWDGYWLVIAMIAALSRLAETEAAPEGRALANKKRMRWRMAARGRTVKA